MTKSDPEVMAVRAGFEAWADKANELGLPFDTADLDSGPALEASIRAALAEHTRLVGTFQQGVEAAAKWHDKRAAAARTIKRAPNCYLARQIAEDHEHSASCIRALTLPADNTEVQGAGTAPTARVCGVCSGTGMRGPVLSGETHGAVEDALRWEAAARELKRPCGFCGGTGKLSAPNAPDPIPDSKTQMDGWVLVPREADNGRLEAGVKLLQAGADLRSLYRVMVSPAPSKSSSAQDDKVSE